MDVVTKFKASSIPPEVREICKKAVKFPHTYDYWLLGYVQAVHLINIYLDNCELDLSDPQVQAFIDALAVFMPRDIEYKLNGE